ncbi:MAG: hypothetical protein EPN20_15150 [Magnetospirillum sp.]|nr:MAG: hypothetical protein EPN20_15150 [Magnetospirillum sp.]
MANTRLRDALVLAGGLALFFWATLPPDKVSFNDDCEPAGGPAAFSAWIYRGSFWQSQLEAAVAERTDLLSQPARRARAAAEAEREARENPALEERMMRLSREQSRIDDRYQREQHEAALQSARLKRIAILLHCEAVIAQKLP